MDEEGRDMTSVLEDNYVEDLQDFLGETGAIEVLSCLRTSLKRMKDIEEELAVSRGYIYERLTEGRGLSLTTKGLEDREGGVHRMYSLSKLGKIVTDKMEEIGLSQTHQRLRTIRLEYERHKDTYEEWVDDPDGLEAEIDELKKYLVDEEEW